MKIARNPAENDLVQHEGKTLKRLLGDPALYDTAAPYLPGYIESFAAKIDGVTRQCNAFRPLKDQHANPLRLLTLEDIRKVYPQGIDPRHMAWMFRRLLVAIGIGGRVDNGVVHGAVLPKHVLIQPEQHGLVLADWKYAVDQGQPLRAIPSGSRPWYPEGALAKEPVTGGLDVWMAVQCMAYVMGWDPPGNHQAVLLPDTIPTGIRAFFRGAQLRPADSWELLEEFNDVVERLWGPRRFKPFYV
jgi:hypothetical protein